MADVSKVDIFTKTWRIMLTLYAYDLSHKEVEEIDSVIKAVKPLTTFQVMPLEGHLGLFLAIFVPTEPGIPAFWGAVGENSVSSVSKKA